MTRPGGFRIARPRNCESRGQGNGVHLGPGFFDIGADIAPVDVGLDDHAAFSAMALAWRARAAPVKAATMLAFGLWVIGYAIYGLFAGSNPRASDDGLASCLR